MLRIKNSKVFFLLLTCFFTMPVWAQSPGSYATAVKKVRASVVNIYTVNKVRQKNAPNVLGQPHHFTRRQSKLVLGSGVILDKRGYILTNYHVIQNTNKIMVALMGERTVKAIVIGVDPETDLAVLKIKHAHAQAIPLGNSEKVDVGDVVLAIGNPFGLGQTVTQGIVSAMGRNTIGLNSLENYIQTDAAINPGNSGGALINTNGELIGINTGIYTHSGGYQGVGFAIPIDNALNVMRQIIKTGKVLRGWLGVEVEDLDPSQAAMLGEGRATGVLVDSVVVRSPARQQGLRQHDIILAVNRQRIKSAHGFQSIIAQKQPGARIDLTVLRDHKQLNLAVTLSQRSPQLKLDDRAQYQKKGLLRELLDDR